MKKALVFSLALASVIGLSACGGQETKKPTYVPEQPQPVPTQTEYTIEDSLFVGQQKLPDGRTVTCVGYNRDGGVSCDWANAK